MKRKLIRLYKGFILLLSLPIILGEYFSSTTGKEYGVGFLKKLFLAFKMCRNNFRIISASSCLEHLLMATQILKILPAVKGSIVECGSYKGGSTANLSLVADLCSRKLEVFDSFQGLPEPSSFDKGHMVLETKELHTYAKGAWLGTLDEVKQNISSFGKISVCNFHVGYFKDTLPQFKDSCVFAFLDVDLRDSLISCLKYLWPLLKDTGYLFTHEASHREIASLFFDEKWWHENLDAEFPGLVGAGNGLGLFPRANGYHSSFGYTVKNPKSLLKEVSQTGQ